MISILLSLHFSVLCLVCILALTTLAALADAWSIRGGATKEEKINVSASWLIIGLSWYWLYNILLTIANIRLEW